MGLEKKWKLLLRELARHLQKHRIEQGGDVFVLLDNSRTDGLCFLNMVSELFMILAATSIFKSPVFYLINNW